MLKKSKLIIRGCIPIVLLLVLLAGFAACKHPTSSESGETFTVTFNASGGTPVPEPLVVSAGSRIKTPEGVKKSYYSLRGWYREPEFKTLWNFENDVVIQDITLYARWGTGGGGSGSGSGGISQYSKAVVDYDQDVLYNGNQAHIVITISHSNYQGAEPMNGDGIKITIDNNQIFLGSIQGSGSNLTLVPSDGGTPIKASYNYGVLSIDPIPYYPYPDVCIPGAILDGSGIEGNKITEHPHVPTNFKDYLISTISGGTGTFDAERIDFNNTTVANSTHGMRVIGYEEGYFGYVSYNSPIKGTLIPTVDVKPGKWIYGTLEEGDATAELDNNMHVAIRESEASQLQFKGGGAPYRLELDDGYGLGLPVGYIEITASGSTNIVTLKVVLNSPNYHINDAYVSWYRPGGNGGSGEYHIPSVNTVYTFSGVPSNTTFTGAWFDIEDITHPGEIYSQSSSTVFHFVSNDSHNTVIIEDAKNPSTDKTVHGNYYDDPDPSGDFGLGKIFEHCDLSEEYGDEYYRIGSSPPYEFLPKSDVVKIGSQYYRTDIGGSTDLYLVGTTYHLSDIETINGTIILIDPSGPDFEPYGIIPPYALQQNYEKGDVIIHAVHNDDLVILDLMHSSDPVKVGVVHIEYNRYESDPVTHISHYTHTITYYFDEDFKTLLEGFSSWNFTYNGIPVSKTTMKHVIDGTFTPTTTMANTINVDLHIDTSFTFTP